MIRRASIRPALRWLPSMTAGALMALLATYVWFTSQSQKPHGVSPVEDKILYRSGQLEPERLAEEIRRRGIKTVVNLGSKFDTDAAVCQRLGVRFVDLPVGDAWCLCGVAAPNQDEPPAAPIDISSLWRLIEDPAAQPVLIHCQGGVHRTGVVTAFYRIRYQHWLAEDAIAEMDRFGFESRKKKFSNVADFIRTRAQRMLQVKSDGPGPLRR